MSPRKHRTARYESSHAAHSAVFYVLILALCAHRILGQDAIGLEDAIGIEFTLESSNGLYFSPDPLAITVKIDNHSHTECELNALFELKDDVCPPRIIFGPYNAVKSKKEYRVYPFAGYGAWWEHRKRKVEWMANMLGVDRIAEEQMLEKVKDDQDS